MDLPDGTEDLDLILRQVTRRFPEHLARALVPPGAVVTSARVSETQVASRERRIDRGLEVVVDGKRRLEHVEWQSEWRADVPFRMYEYNALLAIALEEETPAGEERPRIQSTVVLMSGREKAWPERETYRTSPDDEPFSGVAFRIDPVYQRTVAELEARGPLWAIFTPLAVDADPVRMKAVLDRLRTANARRDFEELAGAITVMAAKDRRQRGLREAILPLLSEEDVMEGTAWEMGMRRGELKGELKGRLETLGSLYERRLQRPLTEGERAALAQRLEKLGLDRLLDAPHELSADALAAWLGDPATGGG